MEHYIVDGKFDFSGNDGHITDELIVGRVDGEFPGKPFFGGFDMFSNIIYDEIMGYYVRLGHFKNTFRRFLNQI